MKFQSILISSNKQLSIDDLNTFLKDKSLLPEQISELNSLSIVTEKNSIGIALLEDIQEWISLKSSNIKFVIIGNAETLTVEAQNSLLKNLEEPPENTQFILITKNSEKILETIRSRCISVISKELAADNFEYKELALKFIKANYLERLKIVENMIKDYESREEISEIIFEIIKSYPYKTDEGDKIKVLKNIYIGIKSSVNLKLSLDLLAIYIE